LLDQGNLSEERQEEILNAFTVGEQPVSDIMTDREDIIFLSTAVSAQENFDRIGTSPHTRFPLIGDDPADYRGVVYVPAVVDQIDELRHGEVTFEDVAAPPMTLRADTLISDAVDQFQDEHQELALVYDEDEENVVGLITATDALEAVMGEIEDPLDIKLKEQKSAPQ
jgi:CBS domain containing-hemolysin-like protein